MPAPEQSKTHLLFIDGIRALAAMYVVAYHAILQYYPVSIGVLNGMKKHILSVFYNGYFAVDVFIVLSGFSLMLPVIKNGYVLKGGSLLFYKRRIIRIVPPYYFAIFFSLILIWLFIGKKTGTHWDISIPATCSDIVQHLLMIHDFFIGKCYLINHVFWSISVEFRIYFFFPLLIWLWRKSGPLVVLLVSFLISALSALLLLWLHQYNPNIILTLSGVSPFIVLFTFGMLAADISFSEHKTPSLIRNKLSQNLLIILIVVNILGLAGIRYLFKPGFAMENKPDYWYYFNDIFIGCLAVILLIICSMHVYKQKKAFRFLMFLNWKPLVFVGTFSYSLYLIHAPLQQILTQYVLSYFGFAPYTNTWLLLIFGTVVLILIAYLFFLLFERPFLRWGKKVSLLSMVAAINDPAP